ncbi:EamA family transporter RarD [uncultured Neptuniibacter sp.]|uniref:EamA family transporter RarD n=1 Tax=uncultured Neptuniibacter sp. TaxID=502143 RepID=UPI00260DADA5|nr:EamA family transporter RarD [uncultured Neptuniibacter sp.]
MINLKPESEHTKGVYFALAAFLMWGLVPVYFKSVEHITALEVVAHRILWSCVFLGAFIVVTRRLDDIIKLSRSPRIIYGLGLSALVISINWLVFIWAVSQDRIIETTLGYFINPLINILFGMIIFKERLRIGQWIAVALAAVGVLYQVVILGQLPWVALVLACSFAIYGVLRKKIPVDSISGLFVETLWLLPAALIYFGWLIWSGSLQFITEGSNTTLLLLSAGLVTSLPLMAFASGARRLSLTLVGLLQYIGPSIAFLIAVFYYNEPMDIHRLTAFLIIWTALVIFSAEGLIQQKRSHIAPA